MLQIAMSKNSSCILVDGKCELKKICLLHITYVCLDAWSNGNWEFFIFKFVILSCTQRKTSMLKEFTILVQIGSHCQIV